MLYHVNALLSSEGDTLLQKSKMLLLPIQDNIHVTLFNNYLCSTPKKTP